MTDKELLEFAAKAAGMGYADKDDKWISFAPDNWNPLTDDGDALRLAVKLNVDVEIFSDITTVWLQIGCGYSEITQPHDGDPYAATRRAIVRAAAEIGKTL